MGMIPADPSNRRRSRSAPDQGRHHYRSNVRESLRALANLGESLRIPWRRGTRCAKLVAKVKVSTNQGWIGRSDPSRGTQRLDPLHLLPDRPRRLP